MNNLIKTNVIIIIPQHPLPIFMFCSVQIRTAVPPAAVRDENWKTAYITFQSHNISRLSTISTVYGTK